MRKPSTPSPASWPPRDPRQRLPRRLRTHHPPRPHLVGPHRTERRTAMSEHRVTCTDEQVRGCRGTVARCVCGWADAWMLQGGNAEASGHDHMRTNDPEYRARSDEQTRVWAIEQAARNSRRQAELLERLSNTPLGPQRKPFDRCHPCFCHLNPPCSQCENCTHAGSEITDCDNDCQDCEVDHT